MSLTQAANSALSGLRMASLTTKLISDNVANALTPGYGVRSIRLSSDQNGTGVQILEVARFSNPALTSSRRSADAEVAAAERFSATYIRIESQVGSPEESSSIAARMSQFAGELVGAVSRPDSQTRLDALARTASQLAGAINDAAAAVQAERSKADQDIAQQVEQLNNDLLNVDELNRKIAQAEITGQSSAALRDQRQALVDAISEIVPVKEMERENGRIALIAEGGAILLDNDPVQIGFTPVNLVTAQMSQSAGSLSGLTINGNPVSTDAETSGLRGGALIAAFEFRDVSGVETQSWLDGLALDLAQRFEDPAIDATRAAGDPGLFTDAGAALDLTAVTGLAQRISLNAAADPENGGESWKLRDGLGAASPGDVGDATLLRDLAKAMETARSAPSELGSGSYSGTGMANYLTTLIVSVRTDAEQTQVFAAAQQSEYQAMEAAEGVDTDSEIQALVVVEQIYAANARIMQTIDEMMADLLRI